MTPTHLPPIDPDAARLLAGALHPGEEIVWAGRPDERRSTRRDPRLVGLGVFWTVLAGAAFYGFAVTLLSEEFAGVARALRVVALTLCAAPFALGSMYLLGGHVTLRRRARNRTAYAVTAERVLATAPALGLFGRPHHREIPRAAVGRVDVEEADRRGVADISVTDGSGLSPGLTLRAIAGADAVAVLLTQRTSGT